MANSAGSRMGVSSDSVSSAGIIFAATVLRIDEACVLHPFSLHKLDAGPVRLMTIAHAFNYRVAGLRKSAVRVGRSRKSEGHFLTDTDLSWGQQVAVMFQIVSTMALEFPLFLEALEAIRGVSPDVHLDCEPWGHINKYYSYRSSVRTAAYVYELAFTPRESMSPSSAGNASTHSGRADERSCLGPCLGGGRPGSVPFVSHGPGAYVRLLLAVYVR